MASNLPPGVTNADIEDQQEVAFTEFEHGYYAGFLDGKEGKWLLLNASQAQCAERWPGIKAADAVAMSEADAVAMSEAEDAKLLTVRIGRQQVSGVTPEEVETMRAQGAQVTVLPR